MWYVAFTCWTAVPSCLKRRVKGADIEIHHGNEAAGQIYCKTLNSFSELLQYSVTSKRSKQTWDPQKKSGFCKFLEFRSTEWSRQVQIGLRRLPVFQKFLDF